MILQLGALFSSIAGGIGGLIGAAAPSAIGFGKALLDRELNRKLSRDRNRSAVNAARQASNLFSPTVALGQTPVPVGGRVTEPTFFPSSLFPPSISPIVAGRPAGTRSVGFREEFGGLAGFPLPGQFGAGGLMPPPTRMLFQQNGGFAGAPGESRFAVNPNTGKAQLFVPGRPGEGMIFLEQAIQFPDIDTSCKFRFNRMKGVFQKIKARRMNPLNFKALGRARTRTSAALRICRTMFTEARRQKTGTVRPKARKRKK